MSNSPLEKAIEFVKPGMKVFYSDMCNNEEFEVVSVSATHIELKDETGEVFEHRIGCMQYGWRLSSADQNFVNSVRGIN